MISSDIKDFQQKNLQHLKKHLYEMDVYIYRRPGTKNGGKIK